MGIMLIIPDIMLVIGMDIIPLIRSVVVVIIGHFLLFEIAGNCRPAWWVLQS